MPAPCPADRSILENAQAETASPVPKSRLWLWFVAAFALQAAAWATWFTIASQHKVREVPLATQHAR
jgi:hypothetical protein